MYQYYLAQIGENQQKLIRGKPDDLLSFATYEPEKEDWDQQFGTFWADKILVSDFNAFKEITEKEAIQFIKVH
ncbi:hypothetical protein L5B97_00185 [Avibacterium sp. 20-15]|uniref:hypothetical protein n=1 Tax=unclassified Avibacterium TaxID=2685287 RepID=UPI002026CE81|nr:MULTISPECIES: hypothetical protein [unclassified Avibacterium]MCW9731919.1 hypothetical protein [Avibacterium sp. 20-15]URL04108.1 hypothetical protein L4F93_11265 [Avibacterium sp. 20-132]